MLSFITTIRHPNNTNQYARVLRLLHWTLESVCAQDSDEFRVLIICNERIDLSDCSSRVREHSRVIRVTMPAPAPRLSAGTDIHCIRRDRGVKHALALLALDESLGNYVMFFDADDFVSNQLASWVSRQSGGVGWFVDQGFLLKGHRLAAIEQFNHYCGTCNIVRADRLREPLTSAGLDESSDYRDIFRLADPHFLRRTLGAHRRMPMWFGELGERMEALPFRAAVYHLDNGENHSDFRIERNLAAPRMIEVTAHWTELHNDFIEEFNIPAAMIEKTDAARNGP